MTKRLGLWIDHRETVLVTLADGEEKTKRMKSGMEKHTRFSGGSRSEQGGGEDQQDRRFTGHLNSYYDEVVESLRDAESILIFGPGEAKGELEKRLSSQGLGGRVVGIETVDTMTERQNRRKSSAVLFEVEFSMKALPVGYGRIRKKRGSL